MRDRPTVARHIRRSLKFTRMRDRPCRPHPPLCYAPFTPHADRPALAAILSASMVYRMGSTCGRRTARAVTVYPHADRPEGYIGRWGCLCLPACWDRPAGLYFLAFQMVYPHTRIDPT